MSYDEDAVQSAKQFVLAVGETFTGFTFYGPFRDATEAIDYAEAEIGSKESWSVLPLRKPEV